jgi:DNA invertase Pin-like site-specific DNA recombinase
MLRVAIYARYSSERQSEKSIDDQIRRCRELAEGYGWTVPDELVFTDAAISGTEAGTHRRVGYQSFMQAWGRGAFDAFIVDDFSRLSRDGVEQAQLIRRLEQNERVQMLTADGVDTRQSDWQLMLGMKGIMAQQDIRKLRHQVGRGMQGQLERGYMIATPAYGYDYQRCYDQNQNRIGTHWVLNEVEAGVVRRVFEMREQGQSLHQIAAWLNSEGIPTARKAIREEIGYWRPSRVRNLLMNTIYRGVFVWHGSSTHLYRAKKIGKDVISKHYSRPDLRLVSDETWNRCNRKTHSRTGYGGGKHFLSGLINCGYCGGTLVLNAERERRSMYCAACTIKNGVKPGEGRLTATVRTKGIQLMLTHALAQYLTPGFLDAFKTSLKLRMAGGHQQAVEACQKELKQWNATQLRLSRMLQALSEDDPVLEARYNEARQKVAEIEGRLSQFEVGRSDAERKAMEAQLVVNPAKLLDGLLEANLPPERLRALLARLFPSIVFLGKDDRYTSYFRVQFAPGAVLAMASQTDTLDEGGVELTLKLRYIPDRRLEEGGWTVTVESEANQT